RMEDRTYVGHYLTLCLNLPGAPYDPHPNRLVAQRWVYQIHDQECLTFLRNFRAILMFYFVLGLIGTEMHHALTCQAHAGILFHIGAAMRRGDAGVVQGYHKQEQRRSCAYHAPTHGKPSSFET